MCVAADFSFFDFGDFSHFDFFSMNFRFGVRE